MSDLQTKIDSHGKVVFVFCSDVHLSHKPPIARSVEPDWYAAMQRPLDEIRQLRGNLSAKVVCAGDIFDRWNSPSELVNFALQCFPPKTTSIPGQHDLPNHNMDNVRRSSYHTLALAGVLRTANARLQPEKKLENEGIVIHFFPWGVEPTACKRKKGEKKHVAVFHRYIWMEGHQYQGAPLESSVNSMKDILSSYDLCVFGDNHKGFYYENDDMKVLNCGTLMRRKMDERSYQPQVGLLHQDGNVTIWQLDCSKDVFIDDSQAACVNDRSFLEFTNKLASLGSDCIDFVEAMKEFLHMQKPEKQVADMVKEMMN